MGGKPAYNPQILLSVVAARAAWVAGRRATEGFRIVIKKSRSMQELYVGVLGIAHTTLNI